jgi:hypothetical protein
MGATDHISCEFKKLNIVDKYIGHDQGWKIIKSVIQLFIPQIVPLSWKLIGYF